MKVRKMETVDLGSVVAIHEHEFTNFFLTRMGPRFLRSYYQTLLDFKDNISLVVEDPDRGRIIGFAVGFSDPQGFYSLLATQRKRMLPGILLAVLSDPKLIPEIFRNARRVEAQTEAHVDAVELSSIAVSDSGRGVGSTLLEAFARQARSKGARKLILTTDAHGNSSVRKFYEMRGFNLEAFECRGSRQLCRYSKYL